MKISDLNFPAHVKVCAFDSREELTQSLSALLQDKLSNAVASKGNASLAVSGGSTPVPLFQSLSQASLPWSKVRVTLVDDRWISPEEADSNDRLLNTHLLQDYAKEACYIPLWQADSTAEAAVIDCQKRLAVIDGQLDVVILGMGNDGHTASLFPCSSELPSALTSSDDCIAVNPTSAPYARMSLTPARLLNSELRILHICGNDKLETLSQALTSTPESMPIKLFLDHPIIIYWAP